MLEVFTFFTDTFQAPVLCHMTNVLAELLVPTDTSIVTMVDRKEF